MKLVVSTLLSVIVAIAGCGGSGGGSNPSPDPTAPTDPTPTPAITPTPDATPSPDPTTTPTSTPTTAPTPTATPGGNDTVATLVKGSIGDNDTVPTINCTQTVDSLSALENAADMLSAGDTLCLANGIYDGDLGFDFEGTGTAENPITIAAETSGGVTVQGGEVDIDMGGEHLVLQGFIFRDGVSGTIIKFESENVCNNCRVTEVSIIDMDSDDPYGSSKWIELEGVNNRIDHCYFSGKTSRGALIVMSRWIDESEFDEATWPTEYAMIDHNYFGDRPPAFGKAYAGSSDNEYEAVRLGLSTTHTAVSHTTVEYNYFERIQGEAEVISNKAASNVIRYNTVRDSNGSIVTRHGANATITNNYVIGDDNPFSGGIRLVDDGHIVTNNYVQGARYLNSNWNGGIVLTTGDGSGRTDNGYQNVENVLVANNTIVDSVNSFNVAGGRENTLPTQVYFVNNIIQNAIGSVIRTNDESMPSNSVFAGNYVSGQSFADDDSLVSVNGIDEVDAILALGPDGLYRPSSNSPDLSADTSIGVGDDFTLPSTDMDGQTRTGTTTSGSDETMSGGATIGILSADLVGPINYTPEPGNVYVAQVNITNHDFDNADNGWTISAPAAITSEASDVFSRGASLKVEGSGVVSQEVTLEENTNYTLSAFTKGTALLGITLADGTEYSSDTDTNEYRFASVSFNSGTNTSARVFGRLPDTIPVLANIVNADFADDLNDWVVIENDEVTDGLGDVGDSSDSAVSGSRAAKFNYRYANDNNSTPGLYQDVTVLPNTDYNLSMYVLVKSAAAGSTATFGVKNPNDDSVLFSKVADYDALEAAGAPKGTNKDHYQDVLSFNSGAATSLRIYAEMDAQTMAAEHIPADPTVEMNSDDRKIYEVRVDDFELSYEDVPPAGSEAFFDSFRLVSHPLSPTESTAAEDN